MENLLELEMSTCVKAWCKVALFGVDTPYVQETLRSRDCVLLNNPRGLCVGRDVD